MDEMIISILQRSLIVAAPLFLASIGEIFAERSGILNLGVEGLLSGGAVAGFITALLTGNPFLGILAALICGTVLSLIHAFVSITLRANQVVSGLALAMLGLGISGLWGKPYIGKTLSVKIEPIQFPFLSDIPYVGRILFQQDIFFYASLILGITGWFILKNTSIGIKIRSVGENPKASDAQGVPVNLIKYICVAIGGALAGIAGAQLSLAYSSSWIEGMSAGRGWIVIALTIFSLWNPLRALWGSILFGFIFVLQYLLQPLGISPNLLAMLPYASTLIVLFLNGFIKGQRSMQGPAMLGEVYKRGDR